MSPRYLFQLWVMSLYGIPRKLWVCILIESLSCHVNKLSFYCGRFGRLAQPRFIYWVEAPIWYCYVGLIFPCCERVYCPENMCSRNSRAANSNSVRSVRAVNCFVIKYLSFIIRNLKNHQHFTRNREAYRPSEICTLLRKPSTAGKSYFGYFCSTQ